MRYFSLPASLVCLKSPSSQLGCLTLRLLASGHHQFTSELFSFPPFFFLYFQGRVPPAGTGKRAYIRATNTQTPLSLSNNESLKRIDSRWIASIGLTGNTSLKILYKEVSLVHIKKEMFKTSMVKSSYLVLKTWEEFSRFFSPHGSLFQLIPLYPFVSLISPSAPQVPSVNRNLILSNQFPMKTPPNTNNTHMFSQTEVHGAAKTHHQSLNKLIRLNQNVTYDYSFSKHF